MHGDAEEFRPLSARPGGPPRLPCWNQRGDQILQHLKGGHLSLACASPELISGAS